MVEDKKKTDESEYEGALSSFLSVLDFVHRIYAQLLAFAAAVCFMSVFLYIVSLFEPAFWYTLVVIISSYVAIDLGMRLFIEQEGDTTVLFRKKPGTNLGVIYFVYALGIVVTSLVVTYFLQGLKGLVDHGFPLTHYAPIPSILVALGAAVSFTLALSEPPDRQGNQSRPPS